MGQEECDLQDVQGTIEKLTTVVIGSTGQVWDLGNKEYPGPNDQSVNAFTCTKEHANVLKERAESKKKGKKKRR